MRNGNRYKNHLWTKWTICESCKKESDGFDKLKEYDEEPFEMTEA